jgi:hypothetical protein
MMKKPLDPAEMRMPANKFDEMMRHALGASPSTELPKAKPKPKKIVKRKKAADA